MEVSKSADMREQAERMFELTALRNWLRRRPLLRRLYQCLPSVYRERISKQWARQMAAAVQFPELPPVPLQYEALVSGNTQSRGVDVEERRRGANLFAYFRGEFGLAEAARSYARALISAGYPVALNDIDLDLPHGFGDVALAAHLVDEAPHPINVVFINPDYLEAALAAIGHAKLAGRYVVACWFWELERVPVEWLPAIAHVDEILVASEFVEQAFRAVTTKPVTCVPLPVAVGTDSGIDRSAFGLESDTFVFLTSFDFHSWVERKNPFAAIEAFRLAFPEQSIPVRLLVKTSNGAHYPEMLARLLALAQADPRILVREGILERPHLRSLQRCCDAYISLHRSEGFGLGLAECMALGKPVIATAWSGNCDFMSADNSCLVSYELIEVGRGEYLHGSGQRWAAPNIAEAASYMRRIFEDRAFASAVGERAAVDIARKLSSAGIAAALIARFEQITTTMPVCAQETAASIGEKR
jgi:glycosyltransferase involved in cell wall biosynthesis